MLFSNRIESTPRILLVDDEPSNLMLLEEALSELGSIYCARNGSEAITMAKELSPDIVLLDIDMPDMSGFEVCQQLKNDSRTVNISIIFVTSYQGDEVEAASLENGGVDFITKPVNFNTCRLRVKNQLLIQQHAKSLNQAKEELQRLVTQVPVQITYWGADWKNQFSNDYKGSWFGVPSAKMAGKHIAEAFPESLSEVILSFMQKSDAESEQFQGSYVREGQSTKFVQISVSKSIQDDEVIGYLLTMVDITSIKLTKAALYNEKERLRITLNSIGDAVIATDTQGIITFINPIAERMTGWHSRDAIGRPVEDVMNLMDANTHQISLNPIRLALDEERIVGMAMNCQLLSQAGDSYRVEDSAAPIRDSDGSITGAIIVFHDVSEAIAMSVKMSHLANHDQLTDLPNRILLHDRLEYACKLAKYTNKKVATFLIDIDHFKYINDTLGHSIGDQLIKQVAGRISRMIHANCTLARVGGDEFLLLVPNFEHLEDVQTVASNVTGAMHKPFTLGGHEYNVSVSVGVSVFPDDATDQETIMRHADVAMYRAKQEGRNRYCFFSDELEQQLMERHHLEIQLREIIAKNRIEVFFQSKVRLSDGAVVGVEALARMPAEGGGYISPLEFIPLAEETKLIVPLGQQILLKACRYAVRWKEIGKEIPVSVNVASAQFAESNFVETVENALKESTLAPHLLELEVTETALMDDTEKAQSTLAILSDRGIKVALDDFGTGYSSLSYLKKFRMDVLKIDQSFVRDMLTDNNDYDIVKTIVSLASSMDLELVAEGVETEGHVKALMALGCPVGQGYLFSKPIPADEFEKYLLDTPNS
ncbi:two-component system response regulator [Hahella sp. CCB-MM4]|uniref:EAL domain-containing protein n=1 Tax=Hahella sp. (strain CCB-MM4) TaxID=1926491 RepID=UPI000B9BD9B7|nr:EAL domain-containing protein [Hahella sp. CCB-MM4]OZG71815.1 two-component system response regulator [Hahella sp. CCB-MM4]